MPDIVNQILVELGIREGKDVDIFYKGYDTYDQLIDALNNGDVDCAFPLPVNPYTAEKYKYRAASTEFSMNMSVVTKGEYKAGEHCRFCKEKATCKTSLDFIWL